MKLTKKEQELLNKAGYSEYVGTDKVECSECLEETTDAQDMLIYTEDGYDIDYTLCNRCALKELMEVKVDGTTTDGIPSKTKVLGILPTIL